MKIFLVCNSLGGGGAERVHVNLANGFAQRDHEVYLIADLNQPASYPVDEQVHVLPLCPQSTNKLKKWGGAVSMLRKNIKKYKPDVVIGNMHLCSIICRLAALGTGVPVVLTIHNAVERPPSYRVSRVLVFCDEYMPYFYKTTAVLTEADKTYLGNRKNITVIPNPLSFPPIDSVEDKIPCVLAAGRLDGWYVKGFDLLIKAWGRIMNSEELKVTDCGWKLQIAGTGSDENLAYLKGLCKENGVEDSVVFLGYVSDMQSLYRKASIYCLSSRSEGFPMVLIEAMSQACAPVATDFKGRTLEVVGDKMKDVLCKPEDVNSIANRLSLMITDIDYRKEKQLCALERSKSYSIDNVIQKWYNLFSKLGVSV